jgi:hypothetical protein
VDSSIRTACGEPILPDTDGSGKTCPSIGRCKRRNLSALGKGEHPANGDYDDLIMITEFVIIVSVTQRYPGIEFDDTGVCNYCHEFEERNNNYPLNDEGEKRLQSILRNVIERGKGHEYDCVIGASGGTDSTYCLYSGETMGIASLWRYILITVGIRMLQ